MPFLLSMEFRWLAQPNLASALVSSSTTLNPRSPPPPTRGREWYSRTQCPRGGAHVPSGRQRAVRSAPVLGWCPGAQRNVSVSPGEKRRRRRRSGDDGGGGGAGRAAFSGGGGGVSHRTAGAVKQKDYGSSHKWKDGSFLSFRATQLQYVCFQLQQAALTRYASVASTVTTAPLTFPVKERIHVLGEGRCVRRSDPKLCE